MLSTSVVNNSSMSAVQREMAGNVGASETGMFDFMNYLLGLQGQTQDWLEPASENPFAMPTTNGEGKAGQDETLLSLFERKNQSPLDPIALSSLFPQGNNPIANPIAIKTGVENLMEKNGNKGLEESFSQNADIKNAISTLDNQGLTGLQMLQRSSEKSGNIGSELAITQAQKEKALQQYLSQQAAHSKTESVNSVYKNTVSAASEKIEDKSDFSISEALRNNQISSKEDLKTEGKNKGNGSNQSTLNNLVLGTEQNTLFKPLDTGALESKGQVVRASLPELFEKVQGMVHQGNGKMIVALNPPTLGQVEIHVTARGKNVEIEMKSENDFAKSAIEGSIGELRSSLEAQDLNLTKLEVQVHRDLDKQVQGDFNSSWVGQDAAFQQSRGFNRDNSSESPWREPSGLTSSKTISTSMRLGGISSASRAMSVADGRVDIRI
ncbi:MAG: flagellar hook-length control protein FliK [Proteobacteria bacterium]|nr:flagellar hook-length control protein FliK [Pseudomonadota bacterium]